MNLCIKDTKTAKGRGVFALRAFQPDEELERCPVILIRQDYATLPFELQRIVFNWKAIGGVEEVPALVLGYGSLYNHANPANARYKASPREGLICFSAARPIAEGEEITINYNAAAGEPTSTHDVYVDALGIPYIS